MYVTRRLSDLLKSPETLYEQPDGPNSGFLVIQDEESETYTCFGCCKRRSLRQLPFPQNKELTVTYVIATDDGTHVSQDRVFLIPVLGQPLSSNRYYAIDAHGKHKGKAITCSKEDDKTTCCFCRCVKDLKPRPLDPHNIYQQLEISPSQTLCSVKDQFCAVSIAQDGYPPYFFRREGWSIYTKTADNVKLDHAAHGLNSSLRARLPNFDHTSMSSIVGEWYCPFMFVNEGHLRDQVGKSVYYEMTLEQRWEPIFTVEKGTHDNHGNHVSINALVEKEEVFVGGVRALWSDKSVVDGVVWFTSVNDSQKRVGLRVEIVERMKWEQARGGWVGGDERQVKIDRVEEFKEDGKWSVFGCYVLVERFNLKRMDGSLVMSYDFKHCHQMRTKWE